jgi:hypothetical protein
MLIDKINKLRSPQQEEKTEKTPPPQQPAAHAGHPDIRVETSLTQPATSTAEGPSAEMIEKAKRLARTIINDIYLYNSAKADEAIVNDNFYIVFASDIKEGKKLYENRIPLEVRNMNDFYREAIDNFLSARKKVLN